MTRPRGPVALRRPPAGLAEAEPEVDVLDAVVAQRARRARGAAEAGARDAAERDGTEDLGVIRMRAELASNPLSS